MKTKRSIYSALFIGCLLAAASSCSNEVGNLPKEKTTVGITATLTGEVETKTDVAYAPAANTKIYMYYKNGANTATDEKGYYTYTTSTWTSPRQDTNADDCIFWDDLVPVNNKYPFFAISPTDTNNATSGTVETDQSTGNINSDLLMAYTEIAEASKMTKVSLTFKHMLSKLTIKVKVGAISSFNSSAVTIQNAKKDYTINYTSPVPTVAVPATVAVNNSATPVNITPHPEADETYDTNKKIKVYSAILPAQTISKIQTVVTVGSAGSTTSYTYTYVGSVALDKGTNTILTLTINGTKVELENIKVTNWIDKTASGDITIDTP